MYRLINIKKALTTVLMLFTLLTAVAQTAGTVTGTVRNEQGETLIGVHVQVLGTKAKAVSDVNGNFTIKAVPGQTLQVSYIGMLKQRVKVGGKPLNIVLKDDNRQIDEVVVTG